MKTNRTPPPAAPVVTEADVREYAYHLYCQGGCAAGHELDNWLEAESCLRCKVPQHASHRRLHHQQEVANGAKAFSSVAKAA